MKGIYALINSRLDSILSIVKYGGLSITLIGLLPMMVTFNFNTVLVSISVAIVSLMLYIFTNSIVKGIVEDLSELEEFTDDVFDGKIRFKPKGSDNDG